MNKRCVMACVAVVILAAGCAKKSPDAQTKRAAPRGTDTAAVATAAPDSIGRGPWKWIATVTPVKRIACTHPDVYTLAFLPDSTVRVVIDCNRGSGNYHIDGKSIRIGPVATTRMMCPPGSMDTVFGQEIDAARSWFVQSDTLMLDLMADSGTMRFVR
jgi:heat shock protein HslJ